MLQQWANRSSVFCMICGKMIENQVLLIKHLYIQHKLQCGHCDERFTNQYKLAQHMLTHGNEICPSEKTSISHKDQKHDCGEPCTIEDKHNGVTPVFRCEICSLSFLRRLDQKKHKMKYHSSVSFDLSKGNGSGDHKFVNKVNLIKPINDFNKSKVNEPVSDGETHYKSDSDNSIEEELNKDIFVKPEVKFFEAKYYCTSCDYSCSLKRELILHERSNHSLQIINKTRLKKGKPHNCEMCKNSYMRKTDLQRHFLKIHTSDEYSLRNTVSIVSTNSDIINRCKENSNGIIVYHCKVCGKILRTKKGFVRHVRVHTGERPFTCHICGKQYRSNTDLSRHLKCVHEGIKKYQCDLCGQHFANKATKNDHRRTHTGEKPFMCDVCGKSFPTSNSIYIHRRIHTNYFPHECKTCEKKFRRKQQLIHHIRTHTGEKPHACDICGKCFAVKDEVTRHKLTHSNEKPHMCPNCGFAFAQKRYLKNHFKTHHAGII